MFFQIPLQLSHQVKKPEIEGGNAVQNPAAFTLPLQGQHLPVAVLQTPGQFSIFFFSKPPDLQHFLFAETGAVHLSAPLHQVVGFVDQEEIIPLHSFSKEPAQMCVGIEHIVVVADHRIHPLCQIQAHLIGADLPFAGLLLQDLPAHLIRGGQKLIDCVVDPVKMSLCIRTGFRIAVLLLTETDLLLGGEHQHLHPQRLLLQDIKGLPGHRPCDGLGGQVEDLLSQTFSHSPYSRKDTGHGLSHSRRRLDKKLLPLLDSPVHRSHQFALSLPVGEGKFHLSDGLVALLFPLDPVSGPLLIFPYQVIEPPLQLLPGVNALEPFDVLCLQMAVSHLHADLLQIMLTAVDIGVTAGLGKMDLHRLLQKSKILEDTLDLIDHHALFPLPHTVRTAFDLQYEPLAGDGKAQGNLRMISGSHSPLDLPVKLCSQQHGILIRRAHPVINVSASQDEFHQRPHGDPYMRKSLIFCLCLVVLCLCRQCFFCPFRPVWTVLWH